MEKFKTKLSKKSLHASHLKAKSSNSYIKLVKEAIEKGLTPKRKNNDKFSVSLIPKNSQILKKNMTINHNRKKSKKMRKKDKSMILSKKASTKRSKGNKENYFKNKKHHLSPKLKKRKTKVTKRRGEAEKGHKSRNASNEKRHYFAVKPSKLKENEENQKILSNKASSLLKKIFNKSTKNIQKKQIIKKFENSQRKSCSRSSSQSSKYFGGFQEFKNQNDFSKYFEINFTQISRITDMKILRESRNRLYAIYESLKENKKVYESIRNYTNEAQQLIFEYLPLILNDKTAQNLLGKMLKYERWSIILIFYFRIADKSNQDLEKLLLVLVEHVWINQRNLFCWLSILKKKFNIEVWDLTSGLRNYKEVNYDMETLVVKCKKSCKFISGFLIKS